MGILDALLGTQNPVSQYVDTHPNTLGAIAGGLGSGNTFAQGLANTATMLPQGKNADVQLQLAIQGRNATADWLANQSNPNLQALSAPVRNGTIPGADAMKIAFAPGQIAPAGSTVLPNPEGPNFNPGGAPQGPQTPSIQQPPVPIGTPAADPSMPAPPPGAIAGPAAAGAPSSPVPLAPLPGVGAPPPTASQGYDPSKPFVSPATNPLLMTSQQRYALGQQLGFSGPPLMVFSATGKMPADASQSFRPATAQDLKNAGIESIPGGQQYQVNNATNAIAPISGSIAASDPNSSALPPGTTGNGAIDPTIPGYTTKVVIGGLTQAAIDQKALAYATSGTQPPMGRTGIAGAQQSAIADRMAEIDPSGNLATHKAQLTSLTQSLDTQQKYLDTTQRSVQNAEAGFQQVVNTFQGKVNTSQYPTLNAAANAIASKTSPADLAAYHAGLQEVANEYTQVFSRGGTVSDAVRNQAAGIIDGNLSVDQMQGVLNELQAQGHIVIQGAQQQVGKITNQINGIVGKAAQGTSAPSSAPDQMPSVSTQAQFDALPSGSTYINAGQQYRKP